MWQALPAPEVVKMATYNGAKALGLEHEIGSLEAGKAADFLCLAIDNVETQPVYSMLSHVAFVSKSSNVTDVWVAGRRLLQDGRLTTLDEQQVLRETRDWGRKIAAAAAASGGAK